MLPPSPRPVSWSRHAMMCARVTMRNSSGRATPVNGMKSATAFWYARRVFGLVMLANYSRSGGTSVRRWNSAAVNSRLICYQE